MNIVFIGFCMFGFLSASIAVDLRKHGLVIKAGCLGSLLEIVSGCAIVAGIVWGFLVLKWWEVLADFGFGIFLAHTLFLWVKDEKVRILGLVADLMVIVLCIFMYCFYLGIIEVGPFADRFPKA